MRADPSVFFSLNVTDTCAVWNVLSSVLLYARACAAGCLFSCTQFVRYECLFKKRNSVVPAEVELRNRLVAENNRGRFLSYSIDIEDLQELEILRNRKRLSLGELSSIAFAKKTQQAFLTDDQKARKLAITSLAQDRVQTTPQLVGWLIFSGSLYESEVDQVVAEHSSLERPLEKHFREMNLRVLELRLAAANAKTECPHPGSQA